MTFSREKFIILYVLLEVIIITILHNLKKRYVIYKVTFHADTYYSHDISVRYKIFRDYIVNGFSF